MRPVASMASTERSAPLDLGLVLVSRVNFDGCRKDGQVIVRGLDLDAYVSRRTTVLDIVAFKVDTRDWLDSLTEEQRQRAIDLAEGHSTRECARRWNVSQPAVSLYRRQLNRSYERFVSR